MCLFHHTEQLAKIRCPCTLNSEGRSDSMPLTPKTTSRLLFYSTWKFIYYTLTLL